MTPLRGDSTNRLDWLIDGLVERVPQVTKAVVQSADGLLMGASAGLSREDAEYLSALAAGVQSLAQGARTQFGAGQVHQTIIEMQNAFLFVRGGGGGAVAAPSRAVRERISDALPSRDRAASDGRPGAGA